MTENYCFPKKDALIVNHPKKSPLVLKMIVLVAAMSCSVCICFVFLKQMEEPSEPNVISANLQEKAMFHVVRVNLTDKNLPKLLKFNLTEKKLPNLVRVNSPHLARVSTMGVDLIEKLSVDKKLSEYPLHHLDNNKTKTFSRKENECRPVSLYAIVSIQRSGSKWFEALLNNHDNIRSHGEIFYDVDRKCNMTVIKMVLDKMYSLNWNARTFRRKKKNCMAAVGFKWMLNQGIMDNHEGIVNYLNHRGVSVILLLRRNHLRRLVSLKANNHDGKFKELNGTHKAHVNSKDEAEILASYKPKLDVKRLIPALEHMERLVAETLQNFKGTHHMVVYYEDLVQNQTQTMKEVLEFVKAPQRTLISGHVKIHTRPLAQQIENWRAVAKVIKRSKYRRFVTANDYEI